MLFNSGQTNRDQQAFIPKIQGTARTSGAKCEVDESRQLRSFATFDPNLISDEEFEEYMSFVESIWSHPSRGMVQNRFSMDNAMHVLHLANYSVTRAKFYLQFPVLYKIETQKDEEDASKKV